MFLFKIACPLAIANPLSRASDHSVGLFLPQIPKGGGGVPASLPAPEQQILVLCPVLFARIS